VAIPPGTRTSAYAGGPRRLSVAAASRRPPRDLILPLLVAGALVAAVLGTAPAHAATSGRTGTHDRAGHRTHHQRHHRHHLQQRHHRHQRPEVIHVPRAFFGIHDQTEQAYGHVPFGSLRLWDAQVSWSDIETAPGVYDWDRLDSLVSDAQAHHVQVTLVLAMTPSFYSTSPTLPPADLQDYADYVRAVMTRYRDFNGERGIAAYQVWNEGNVSSYWTGTPLELAELTKIVHQVAQQVDPGATVVAPPFAMRLGSERTAFEQYETQLVDGTPVWHFYDANALSLYPRPTYGGRPGGPEDAMRLVRLARALLAEAHVPARKQLWGTEINYGLQMGTPVGGTLAAAAPVSENRQVANVIRTYLLGAALGLQRVFWYRYSWQARPEADGGGTYANTLMSDPSDPALVTPAGRALATVESWLHGRLLGLNGRQPCARNRQGTYTCVVRYARGVRTIYWNPQRRVRVDVPRGARYGMTALGGKIATSRRAQPTLRVSFKPVMVRSRRR
jgi:hypothetical protein